MGQKDAEVDDHGVIEEFKQWVFELRDFLEETNNSVAALEKKIRHVETTESEQSVREYFNGDGQAVIQRLKNVDGELAGLVKDLPAEPQKDYQTFFRNHLLPYFLQSPMIRRAYEKPLGYAGDYEVMNMIYRCHEQGETLFAKLVDLYALQEPASIAVRNRSPYLEAKIRKSLASASRSRVRLANIGCGPARELKELLSKSPELGSHLDIALVDQDKQALDYCKETLSPIAQRTGARLQLINESATDGLPGFLATGT